MNYKLLVNYLNQYDHIDYLKRSINNDSAKKLVEKYRWNGNPVCPHCGSLNPYKTKIGYKCSDNECYKRFSIIKGTIFENSKIPLKKWIHLFQLTGKGLQVTQIARIVGISQKTAHYAYLKIATSIYGIDWIKRKKRICEIDKSKILLQKLNESIIDNYGAKYTERTQ